MKKPTNTTQEMKGRMERGDQSALLEGLPGMIEASEARGQREMVESTALPTDFNQHGNAEAAAADRAALESWGFKLGEPFPDDPLFMPVELPPGWTKEGTDHSLWSKVMDDKGRERIAVFYKAASYDRGAHMSLTGRYGVDYETVEEHRDFAQKVVRRQVIDRQEQVELASFTGSYDETDAEASAFLKELVGEKKTSDPSFWTE